MCLALRHLCFLMMLAPGASVWRTLAKPTRPEPTVMRRSTYDSSHKAGLAWSDTSVDVSQFLSKAGWYYNWNPVPAYPQTAMDGLEYVPMFWGNKSITQFAGMQQLVSGGGIEAVLGMNEPTTLGQSELSPGQATDLWMKYMEPLKLADSSLRLGSPAMANGDAGIPWMQQFLGNCTTCSVDFIALHYYYINATDFIKYINGYHDTFQKPIWVTEWACVNFANLSSPCPDSYIPEFMNVTQSYMDQTGWVERYAWFGAFRTMPGGLSSALQLYDKDGHITSLGRQYVGNGTASGDGGRGGGSSPCVPLPRLSLVSALLSVFAASFTLL